MIIEALSLLVAVLLIAAILTQMVIPALTGQAFFPFFRASWRALSKKGADAENDLAEARAEVEAARHSKEASKLRSGIADAVTPPGDPKG